MRVLVVGSGGREHALAWRLKRDPSVGEVLAAPGNPGISRESRCLAVDPQNPANVLELAERERIDLTVVGPEAPLERGLADVFRAAGRPIVGPSARGAALECSKAFAKRFMARHDIPTARFRIADAPEEALAAVSSGEFGFPVVIKADGLAAGKGVVIAEDRAVAHAAISAAMVERQFGDAGAQVVIEECLSGPEVSFFVVCDGSGAVTLGTAQDHKRIWDGDRGPNTGGMGAFAPSPLVDAALTDQVMRTITEPVLEGMRAENDPYCGFLYVSLMLTPDGPKVIEFNVRLGDPEAQALLPILSGDLAALLFASATGVDEKNDTGSRFSNSEKRLPVSVGAASVGVVLASRGYPGPVDTGHPVSGLERAAGDPNVLVFHGATRAMDGGIVTAGGRVLTVVGMGSDFEDATRRAYAAVDEIKFDGMQYRRDIGRKAMRT
jgi:phosphoribosylamine---glycine ligase